MNRQPPCISDKTLYQRVFFLMVVSSVFLLLPVVSLAQTPDDPAPVETGFSKQENFPALQTPLSPEGGNTEETLNSADPNQISSLSESTLFDNFQKGGTIMYFILLCSVAGVYISIERFFVLRRSRMLPRSFINQVLDNLFEEDPAQQSGTGTSALEQTGEMQPHASMKIRRAVETPEHIRKTLYRVIDSCEGKDIPIARVLRAGLLEFDEGLMGMKSAITGANMHEGAVMEKGLSILGMLGNIAPLLGLLGTVTGMIRAFEMISIGGSGRPEIVASGISVALVTTAGGLFVGIPLVLFYHFIQHRIESLMVDLQEFSVDVAEKLFRECRR